MTIDNRLFEQAVALTGVQEESALLREGLKALIERESARRRRLDDIGKDYFSQEYGYH